MWSDMWDAFGGLRGDIYIYDKNKRLSAYFCADSSLNYYSSGGAATGVDNPCALSIRGGLRNSTAFKVVKAAAVRAGEGKHLCAGTADGDADDTDDKDSASASDTATGEDDGLTGVDDDYSGETVSSRDRKSSHYRSRRTITHKRRLSTLGWWFLWLSVAVSIAVCVLLLRWWRQRYQVSQYGSAMLSRLHASGAKVPPPPLYSDFIRPTPNSNLGLEKDATLSLE
jgi:hypothetical protein